LPAPYSCGSTTAPVAACCWFAIFHASFDAAINQLSYDVVPAPNTTGFLIFSAVIILFAATVIIATKGQLVRRPGALSVEGDIAAEHPPDDAEG
jgi:hypothetical protein